MITTIIAFLAGAFLALFALLKKQTAKPKQIKTPAAPERVEVEITEDENENAKTIEIVLEDHPSADPDVVADIVARANAANTGEDL